MKRIDTALMGVCVIEPKVFGDSRGFFLESWNRDAFSEIGISTKFVQDNHSRSQRHVLRGVHYQLGSPQAKLVRVVSGEIFDVAVDVRMGSPTFGRWVGEILSAANHRQLYIPEGFAHGMLVLSETADMLFKCSEFYRPAEERGFLWNDPSVGIDWPMTNDPVLSPRDIALPTLMNRMESDFIRYGP